VQRIIHIRLTLGVRPCLRSVVTLVDGLESILKIHRGADGHVAIETQHARVGFFLAGGEIERLEASHRVAHKCPPAKQARMAGFECMVKIGERSEHVLTINRRVGGELRRGGVFHEIWMKHAGGGHHREPALIDHFREGKGHVRFTVHSLPR